MLTQIIETLSRPGLLGIVGRTAENRLARALQAYFRMLGQRVLALNLQGLTEHDPILVRHAVEMRLHNTLRIVTPLLKTTLEVAIKDGMLRADKIHHFAEADAGTDDSPDFSGSVQTLDQLGLTGQDAADYAAERAAHLVTGINATTQQLIADMIEKGIDSMLGVDGTARLIRQTFQDMSLYRSQLIATTEMNDAFSEAALQKLDRLGVQYKQWITGTQCCDECSENEDASPILLDEDFPSGDARPPAHPNCRCAVTGARPPTVQ